MDIPRGKAHKRKKAILRVFFTMMALVVIAGVTWYLSQLEPAAFSVDFATQWIEKVETKDLIVKVRGPGTLVPEEELFIPAITSGRVERIVIKPGQPVGPNDVILILNNPELEQDELNAKLRYQAEEARTRDLEVQLEQQVLTQKAAVAQADAAWSSAQLEADRNSQLFAEGLVDELTNRLSQIRASNQKRQKELEEERLKIAARSSEAQLAARQADVETAKSLWQLRREQMGALHVRAGISGQLQEVPVEVGQQLSPGTNVARVARPEKLMAELRIPETQASEITVGQSAIIDTRNGKVPGHVIRIDPAAQQGQVQVDVALDGALPSGARPQLSVDGEIIVDRLDQVMVMGRPAYGSADSLISLYRVVADGTAVRTQVQLGRSSVQEIQVVSGLNVGDSVILSDTSAFDEHEKIRLIR